MKWKSKLFSIVRSIFAVCLLCFIFMPVGHAASVPVSTPLADPLPPTCDPEFWDVLKDRAWEEGQREITQNNNLNPRPDSVLSMSCFHIILDYLALYGDNFFPGRPDESIGLAGGMFTNMLIIAPDAAQYSAGNIMSTDGFLIYSVLELLVLDQLSDIGDASSAADDAGGLGACPGKEYFINSNYPVKPIGGRDLAGTVTLHLPDSVVPTVVGGCPQMNNVWKWSRTKCYDFETESSHDGFYSLEEYSTSADFRTKDNACPSPKPDGSPDLPSNAVLSCSSTVHSTPAGWTTASLAAIFAGNVVPTWPLAFSGANPPPEPDPAGNGAMDQYVSYLGLRDSTSCAALTPIKTGFIVTKGAIQYADAVCPAPGCYFDPPATIAGTGSCN